MWSHKIVLTADGDAPGAADAQGMFRRSHTPLVAATAALVIAAPAVAAVDGGKTRTGVRNPAAMLTPSAITAPSTINALESGVLAEVNGYRRSHGLVPLRLSSRLTAAAGAHSRAMATKGFFAHESADGTAFWKRVQRYYPSRRFRTWSVGETLLWSSPGVDPGGALRMWVNSPPHRRVLLNGRWREVGLSAVHVKVAPGVFNGLEVTVVTADFGVRR